VTAVLPVGWIKLIMHGCCETRLANGLIDFLEYKDDGKL
jgi:hypothetical protein